MVLISSTDVEIEGRGSRELTRNNMLRHLPVALMDHPIEVHIFRLIMTAPSCLVPWPLVIPGCKGGLAVIFCQH